MYKRQFFALAPLLLFLWIRNEFPNGLKTSRPFGHLLRGFLGAVSLFTSFAALNYLNISEAMLLAQLSPIFMAAAAVFLLSERLTIWRVGGLVFGFMGVIILVSPDLNAQQSDSFRLIGYAIGLISALFSALALVMVRSLNKTESPGSIAFYFVMASMICTIFTMPYGWIVPRGEMLLLLIAAGIFGGFAHITMTLAFRYAEASRLAPYEYIVLIWPILIDLLVFNRTLSTAFLIAIPFILAGVFIATIEKTKLK